MGVKFRDEMFMLNAPAVQERSMAFGKVSTGEKQMLVSLPRVFE